MMINKKLVLLYYNCVNYQLDIQFNIIEQKKMSYENGSRFGGSVPSQNPNYYAPPPFPNNSAPEFNYQSPPIPNNTFNNSQNINDPNLSPQPYQGQALPLSAQMAPFKINQAPSYPNELLLLHLKPYEKAKFKEDNLKKYNMKFDSIVYQYLPKHMEHLIVKYPSEFPPELPEQLRGPLTRYRKDANIFHGMTTGTIIYWFLLRNKPWFKLTGAPLIRFSFLAFNFVSWMDASFIADAFIAEKVCEFHEPFEKVIKRYEIQQLTRGRLQLLTD